MSRFSGWTLAKVQSVSKEPIEQKETEPKKLPKITIEQNDYVSAISQALSILGVSHVLEYKFLKDRRFRFDIAVPEVQLAIEFEGGIFSGGRHTRGAGYSNDCKKYNLAIRHGWTLLRYSSADVSKKNWEFRIADEIREFIDLKRNEYVSK